jgi:hypothetical protein
MLSKQQKTFLRPLYNRVADRPLHPELPADAELYVPVYQSLGEDGDPIERLARHIGWKEGESLQMFSGFRGAGKTTELFRLKQELEKEGYLVLYANALDYLNPGDTIDITGLLLALAGAFGERLTDPSVLGEEQQPSYWTDGLAKLLPRIKVDSINVAGFKLEFKASASFRRQVQEVLSQHLGPLKQNVDEFVTTCLQKIAKYQPDATRQVVFLFDSLEQIRGTASTELAVQNSVERLFGQHLDKLQLPGVHVVYTVPPWLKYVSPGLSQIELLPSIKQWQRGPKREPYAPGNDALRTLVGRRFGSHLLEVFASQAQVDRLIAHCGGHFRDLLGLLGEVLRRTPDLPVPDKAIEQALAAARSHYLPLALDDAAWLHRIAEEHAADSKTREHTSRLIRFLDTHMVLYLRNGDEWYDVHPLIREEVRAMVARAAHRADKADSAE